MCGPGNQGETRPRNGAVPSLTALREANERFGNVSQLGDILTAPPPAQAGARTKPVKHPWQTQFSLYDVREDVLPSSSAVSTGSNQARFLRKRPHPNRSANTMAQFSVLRRRMELRATTLATLWTRDDRNFWKLVSYDVDPVWDEHRAPNTATSAPPAAPTDTRQLPPI